MLIAKQAMPTGQLLMELLREKGMKFGSLERASAVVCYGVQYAGELPVLNGAAGARNKLEELRAIATAGVATIPFSLHMEQGMRFPILGRKLRHHSGTDIRVLFDPEDMQIYGPRFDFFTQFLPSDIEMRLWVYRNSFLAAYEKVLAHPQEKTRFGRSAYNGYAFELRPGLLQRDRGLAQLGIAAVRAVGLDFGAVDVIHKIGDTRQPWRVLEVNSAPGVEGPRVGLTALAKKIVAWEKAGFPTRQHV